MSRFGREPFSEHLPPDNVGHLRSEEAGHEEAKRTVERCAVQGERLLGALLIGEELRDPDRSIDDGDHSI